MALDGITCSLLAKELNDELVGARIDKVFEPDKYNFYLHIRTNSSNKKLLISINPSASRMCITNTVRENPLMPPQFCMLLRKHCQGARITKITCPDYERIIEIHFTTTDELHDTKDMRLIAELMGRYSNLILVNSTGKILDSAIHVDFSINRIREVMPARIYEYPPRQNKMLPDEAMELLSQGSLPILGTEMNRPTHKAILGSIMGISPLLVSQICIRAKIDDKISINNLDDDSRAKLKESLTYYISKIINYDISPSTFFSNKDEACDFYIFSFDNYDKVSKYNTISEAICSYYETKDSSIDFEMKRNNLLSIVNTAISHAARKENIHRQDLEEGRKCETYKNYGDNILCYTYQIKPKDTMLKCVDIYDENGREISIPLDPSLSSSDNAQEYYKKFHKAKRKLEVSEEYLADDENAINYLRSLKSAILSSSTTDDLEAISEEMTTEANLISTAKKPKNKENTNINPNKSVGMAKSGKASSRALRAAAAKAKSNNKNQSKKTSSTITNYRKYETSDGHIVYSGRNNIQNDYLTFKIAKKEDWWFHVKGAPGTHVILVKKPHEDIPSDSSVIEAAELAAHFSREIINEENLTTDKDKIIEVDYCPVSHLKKIPKAKPGMVIYEGYYSINVSPKEIKHKTSDSD